MPQAAVDEITPAMIAELHRQAEISGKTTEDNGNLVQIDGSSDAQQLAEAVLKRVNRLTAV